MNPAFLEIQNLSVGYGKNPVLENLSVIISKGEILTLIGANGAGKSTVLKTLAGQLKALSGEILLENQKLEEIPANQKARKIAIVLTQRIDPELMTCADVVASGRYPYTGKFGILSDQDHHKIREAMAITHISELYNRDFHEISDGQRQRVMIARAVCQEPELLILDEPTSFLDIRYKLELLELIRMLAHKKQITVIMSLHELELAKQISDRLLCLNPGNPPYIGTPEEVFTNQRLEELYQLTPGSYEAIYQFLMQ